jgi:hypothetical protein
MHVKFLAPFFTYGQKRQMLEPQIEAERTKKMVQLSGPRQSSKMRLISCSVDGEPKTLTLHDD